MATEVLFSDIDLHFTKHPISGDVVRKTNDEAIKQSLKVLLLTMYYERPFHSDLGSPIRQMMFEPITPILNVVLQKHIEQVITNFEPRITIDQINIHLDPDNNNVEISLYYYIVHTTILKTFSIILERTR